jgi:hypothetical protein
MLGSMTLLSSAPKAKRRVGALDVTFKRVQRTCIQFGECSFTILHVYLHVELSSATLA